ncbi:MAG: mycothiol maleylpyruvate isomerase domain-containing protein, partial [bacterium]
MTEDLRHPTGRVQFKANLTPIDRSNLIAAIAEVPANLRKAVANLNDTQLDTPYRPDGWTVRQVVHHVPDSHMNAFLRVKLALTEDNPTIKPYQEALWANLPDAGLPIDASLRLLEALTER